MIDEYLSAVIKNLYYDAIFVVPLVAVKHYQHNPYRLWTELIDRYLQSFNRYIFRCIFKYITYLQVSNVDIKKNQGNPIYILFFPDRYILLFDRLL